LTPAHGALAFEGEGRFAVPPFIIFIFPKNWPIYFSKLIIDQTGPPKISPAPSFSRRGILSLL